MHKFVGVWDNHWSSTRISLTTPKFKVHRSHATHIPFRWRQSSVETVGILYTPTPTLPNWRRACSIPTLMSGSPWWCHSDGLFLNSIDVNVFLLDRRKSGDAHPSHSVMVDSFIDLKLGPIPEEEASPLEVLKETRCHSRNGYPWWYQYHFNRVERTRLRGSSWILLLIRTKICSPFLSKSPIINHFYRTAAFVPTC